METEKELLESESPLVAALRTYHDFSVEHAFSEQERNSPVQCLLGMHAFMIYLGSLRVAFSGHAAAAFPLFRTALESACYAFLIGEREELESVWLSRNSSAKALKSCRKAFTSAVKDAAVEIQKKSWVAERTEEWINELYGAAIDFGAHPNPKSVWPYVDVNEDRDDGYVAVSLTSLYGAKAHATSRCLVACLDYGLLVAVILASCDDDPSEEALLAINEMNELKERLVRECFE